MSVSFIPLFPSEGWQSRSPPGTYTCNCGQYFLRYSDPSVGGDKPHIYANYNGFQVDMIEVSDSASYVNGLDAYSNFTATTSIQGGRLEASYSSPPLNYNKEISVGNGMVNVTYTFSKNVTLSLTLWRWYYASVGPYDRPVNRNLTMSGHISFSFIGQGAGFNATINADPVPIHARVSGIGGTGLNKISLEFQSSKVSLSMRLTAVTPMGSAGVVEVDSANYAYPIMGAGIAAIYLVVRGSLGSRAKEATGPRK